MRIFVRSTDKGKDSTFKREFMESFSFFLSVLIENELTGEKPV